MTKPKDVEGFCYVNGVLVDEATAISAAKAEEDFYVRQRTAYEAKMTTLTAQFSDAYFERCGRTDPLDGIVTFYRDLSTSDQKLLRGWLYTFGPSTWQAVARVHLFGATR